MAGTASGVFLEMWRAVKHGGKLRESSDAASPCRSATVEAEPGCTFRLENPSSDVVRRKRVDLRWAAANALHFFACTEDAAPLRRYNEEAVRFLDGDRWIGAYGNVFRWREAVHLLEGASSSRRAVCTAPSYESTAADINRPSCWSVMHFLMDGDRLTLLVYQRSLHLHRVMPYDCIALCNVLLAAAGRLGARPGPLVWTVGSLHTEEARLAEDPALLQGAESLLVPPELAWDAEACWAALEDPGTLPQGCLKEALCTR